MASILNSLKLLADATRLRILLSLGIAPLTVAELQEILGMGQSRISTQLAALKKEGLVKDERSGKNVMYSLAASPELMALARQAGEEIPDVEQDRITARLVLQKRENKVKAYFDDLAGKFGRNYVPGRSWKALAEALLRSVSFDVVADLGAGEATVSQMMARRARQVIAVDNSSKMVELGRRLSLENNLINLEYRLGDIEEPPITPGTVNLAMMSQSLHHAVSPLRAIKAAYDILAPGGCLIVLDLLKHTFEKARDLYADLWLGFGEAELLGMMEKVGFSDIYTDIVDKETRAPHFQTLLGVGWKREAGASL